MTLRSTALAAPYAKAPNASIAARVQYSNCLRAQGFGRMRAGDHAGARADLSAAREVASDHGEMSSNIDLAVAYIDATSWLHETWLRGSPQNAKLGEEYARDALAGIAKVIEKRPNHAVVMDAQTRVQFMLGYTAYMQRRQAIAQEWFEKQDEALGTMMRNDPKNQRYPDNIAIGYGFVQKSFARLGRPADALRMNAQVWRLYEKETPNAYQSTNLVDYAESMASIHAELGETAALDDMLVRLRHHSQAAFRKEGETVEGLQAFVADFEDLMFNARAGRPQANGAAAAALIQRGEAILKKTPANGIVQSMVSYGLTTAHDTAARLAIAGADFKSAEAHAREALALTTHESDWDNDAVQKNVIQAEHALALARLKRYPEAVTVANQALAEQRALLVGSDDQMLRFEMAQSLYALALAKPGAGRAEMQEAAALLANLPSAMQRYRSVKMWRARVAAEL